MNHRENRFDAAFDQDRRRQGACRTRVRAAERAPSRSLALTLGLVAVVLSACGNEGPDAYGNFEADAEVTVSSEVSGTLLRFEVRQGERLEAGRTVGQVDSLGLFLERRELELQQRSAVTRAEEARAQLRALEARLGTAEQELARTRRLYQREAATATEQTRREGEVETLSAEVQAARVRARLATEETEVIDARIDRLDDRAIRTTLVNPVGGTVLVTFVEPGEFVQPGRALYTVAPLDTLVLRAYLSGSQLSGIRLGDRLTVRYDQPDGGLGTAEGRVSWISDQAEFTPTPIQTREERVDQVYAVKVRVPNPEGRLKIGMPGELWLPEGGSSALAGESGPGEGGGGA
jgi:HlyD family secretion protein